MENVQIVYIDDDPLSIALIRNFIKHLSHITLHTTRDPNEFIRIIKKNEIALILSDINMPTVSGFDLAKQVKQIPEKDDIPFVFLTASNPDLYSEAYKLGAVEFISKPVNQDLLIYKINIFYQLYMQKKELEENNEVIERLYQKMNMFLNIVSHDLRAPLNSIYTAINIIINQQYKEKDKTYFYERIKQTCSRTLTLVDDFLNISVLQSGEMEMEFDEISLHDLLETIQHELQETLNEQHIKLSIKTPVGLKLYLDKDRMSQAIINIIYCMLKYIQKPNKIRVVGEIKEQSFTLSLFAKLPEHVDKTSIRTHINEVLNEQTFNINSGDLGLFVGNEILKKHGSEIHLDVEYGLQFRFGLTMEN